MYYLGIYLMSMILFYFFFQNTINKLPILIQNTNSLLLILTILAFCDKGLAFYDVRTRVDSYE